MPPRGRCFLVTLLVLATALGARASIAAPVITNVEPGNQQVTLSYQRIPTSVPPVRQMSIACTDTRITPDPQNAEQQVSVLPNATSVTITGLTNGIYYTCTLKARAWTSNSLFAPVTQSPTSESSPAFMPTAAPINIDLEPGQDGTSITVRFDPPKDGAAAISYYVVACAPTAANSGAVSPASRVVPASNATLASEVKGLTTAVEYKCGVQARSSTSSSSTASASVVTGTTNTPRITGTRVSGNTVTLTFTAPTNPNLGPVASYALSCLPEGSVSAMSGPADSTANELSGSVGSASVSGLTPGKYICTLTATMSNSKKYSASTSVTVPSLASATPAPAPTECPTVSAASTSPSPVAPAAESPASGAYGVTGAVATLVMAGFSALLLIL
ncbi:hypothetical protein F751_1001 [Auxenochlorella protothecoides]|uniref:Fibronectin type-III domain-containing protein n=1 Tax=Auxenochlorella protothecoides TaxID=3075 RepID=A0A087SC51_AUXPR|nr:hypothetical protein F751_1001 [Auxenochlorella protothecoides]KFM23305.1 hypothetical protein F751_1001 [Auxenochlorella protothecoides]